MAENNPEIRNRQRERASLPLFASGLSTLPLSSATGEKGAAASMEGAGAAPDSSSAFASEAVTSRPRMEVPMRDEPQAVASGKRPADTNPKSNFLIKNLETSTTGAATVAPDKESGLSGTYFSAAQCERGADDKSRVEA